MSTGHLTDSQTHATATVSNDVVKHPEGPQYKVSYDQPHVTSGVSVNSKADLEKTKAYNEDLKKIMHDIQNEEK